MVIVICSMVFLSACQNISSQSELDQNTTSQSDTTKSSSSESGYADEIDKTQIMTFEISVNEDDWQTMLDSAEDKEYISADVTINGTTIKNVGIRPKGNSSLSQVVNDDTTDRYSFKIKFDEYVDGQTWMGLDKIVINNMYSDATYMKEYLSYDIMDYIGVESPLFAFADISVNGENWGFYLAVEDIDSGYLDRVFDGEGELYKPNNDDSQFEEKENLNKGDENNQVADSNEDKAANPEDNSSGTLPEGVQEEGADNSQERNFSGNMNSMSDNGVSLQYTDDDIDSYSAIFDNAKTDADESDYERVITALKNLNEGTDLETYIDVEEVLKYFAAQTAVVNLDSYISNMGHNYYLYENDGKLSILPWDYNLAFGGFQSEDASDVVNFPIDTPVSGVTLEERPLLGKLLEVPEYLELYHSYLQEIIDGYFSDGKFEEKVDSLNTLISDYVQNDSSAFYTYDEYETAVEELKELGTLRAESIQGQLDGTIPSTSEGQEENPDALIDASSIDLSDLGSQGGSNMGGQMPGGNGMGYGQNGYIQMPQRGNMDQEDDSGQKNDTNQKNDTG